MFLGVGSILIAPLIKRYHTRTVLSMAILGFGILTAILLICDGQCNTPYHFPATDCRQLPPAGASDLMVKTTTAPILRMQFSREFSRRF
jgi:hypothetical protein